MVSAEIRVAMVLGSSSKSGFWHLWAVVLCLLAASVASAQPDEPEDEAKRLFTSGRAAFEQGRFEDALHDFEASYASSGRAQLLYNIAQCHDRMRKDRAAIDAFERYLAAAPDADNRAAVEARLALLRAAVVQADAPQPEVPVISTPSPSPPPRQRQEQRKARVLPTGPMLTLGAGFGVAASGGVLMILGQRGRHDVEQARDGISYGALRNQLDKAEHEWLAGQVLVGVGAAVMVAAGAWFALERRDARTKARLSLLPNGLAVEGTF